MKGLSCWALLAGLLVLALLPTAAAAQAPTLSIDSPSPLDPEGDSGSNLITFTVTYSGEATSGVSAEYRTVPIDATQADFGDGCGSGADYLEEFGAVTFFANDADRTREISVPTCGDNLHEVDETFRVELFNEQNATVANRQSTGQINDDDPAPALQISNLTIAEPPGLGSALATFDVRLSTASGRATSFDFATDNGFGTATGGMACGGNVDYVRTTGGPRTIPSGALQPTLPVQVTVCGDLRDEPSQTFRVNLTNLAGAAGTPRATGTITDDDAGPTITVTNATVEEPDAGTRNAAFRVNLSAASEQEVRVSFATGTGTARAGTACGSGTDGQGVDYVTTTGTRSIPPLALNRDIVVAVCGDRPDEANETFPLNLTNPVNGAFPAGSGATLQATGTIVDNDPLPELRFGGSTARDEGNSGVSSPFLAAILVDPRDGGIVDTGRGVTFTTRTVDGTTADASRNATGGAACGSAGVDYETQTGVARSIAAGGRLRTVPVRVCGDVVAERSELLSVVAQNVQNATLVGGTGVVTIVNDDGPTLVISNSPSAAEGETMTFTVTLNGATSQPVSVAFATQNGTAFSGPFGNGQCTVPQSGPFPGPVIRTGNDYAAKAGTLVFPASTAPTQTQTITVGVCVDDRFEDDETVEVVLSRPDFARIVDGEGQGTIPFCFAEIGGPGCPFPSTGTGTLDPEKSQVRPGERAAYELTWEVPEGRVWRDLASIDLRIGDARGSAIWLRWFEDGDTFCLVERTDGPCLDSAQPGAGEVLSGPLARLHLWDTVVTGSGATGRTVTLRLSLVFGADAKQRKLTAEAAATDDFGRADPFASVGSIKLKRAKRGR